VSIELVLFEPRHVASFEEMVDDPEVAQHTPLPSPPPAGFGTAWLARYESARKDGTREAFAVVEGDELLGVALAPSIDVEGREIELGYLVAARARGRGVATQSLRLLTEWAFGELRMARASLLINVGNEASRRVAQRCGYTYEGTLRSTFLKDDRRVDTEVWSRLPDDPL
jgi:RimJ/RimL family protein N-acetyltransferase